MSHEASSAGSAASSGATFSAQVPAAGGGAAALRRSTWLLVLAALLFAVMALAAKTATAELPVPEIVCLRFFVGLVAVLGPVGLGVRLRPYSYRALSQRGVLGALSVLAFFTAIAHLPVGVASLLNYSFPLFVALFSALFLGEPLGLRTVLAFVLTSGGITMVVLGNAPPVGTLGRSTSLLWALVGLSSAVFSGAAVTTIRSMRHREGSWEIFLAFCVFGFLMTVVPTATHWVTPSLMTALCVLVMGLASVGGQVLMTYSLRDVPAVRAGLLLQVTPIATFVLGIVALHDRPRALSILGAVVTLAGVSWGGVARR